MEYTLESSIQISTSLEKRHNDETCHKPNPSLSSVLSYFSMLMFCRMCNFLDFIKISESDVDPK